MATFAKKTFRKKTETRTHTAPKAATVRKRAFAKSPSSVLPVQAALPEEEVMVPVIQHPAPVVAAPPAYAPSTYIPGQQPATPEQYNVEASRGNAGRPSFHRSGGGFGSRQGGRQQRSQGGDANFEYITTLYKSKTGSSYNVFIRPEALEILMTIREGDVIGVSKTKEGDQYNLWLRRM